MCKTAVIGEVGICADIIAAAEHFPELRGAYDRVASLVAVVSRTASQYRYRLYNSSELIKSTDIFDSKRVVRLGQRLYHIGSIIKLYRFL